MYIDTHAHLNADQFVDNYDDVIERAKAAGVNKMIVVGFDTKTIERAIMLAEKYDFLYASVGWHPVDAYMFNDDSIKLIEKYITHPKVVAVGECGLDYHWDTSTKEQQHYTFRKNIELAKKYKKPLIVHNREATQDTFDILKEMNVSEISGVMHCYSGSLEMAHQFIDIGMYISLGGPVTFKNGKKPKEVAKGVPLDRLLIETDCPYLAPHPHRGKQNEPMYLPLIATEIANQKELSIEEVKNAFIENTNTLFKI